MTHETRSPNSFSVPMPITEAAHQMAQTFASQQPTPGKREQIYRNTLAVYAVHHYLQLLGIPTDLSAGDCWNPMVRLALDVADLEVTGRGRLECRPVEPDQAVCMIPTEAQVDRIGYIVVEIDAAQQEATLLGFVDQVSGTALGLRELRSLTQFPAYLQQVQPKIVLSQWFEGIFYGAWQILEAVFTRQPQDIAWAGLGNLRSAQIRRAKTLDLGLLLNQKTVALVIALQSEVSETPAVGNITVLIQVLPMGKEEHLPPGLKLKVNLESEQAEVEARAADNLIQLEFSEPPGTPVTVQVQLADTLVTEEFIV
ncbi:MAG: DUF1822 family protein [Oscillatoriales cyanobacterium C42_A2020_001]|nr:DUF1822 family protein [Leptolyngbyaceae cyanobacterium C42_A2020_001]